jgi:hypothetical protein
LFAQPGFFIGGPDQNRGPPTQRESSFHDRRRLSSAPLQNRCRFLVAQSFVNGCVAFLPAGLCFISALIVIGVSSTAAHDVVKNPAGGSAARPTAAINRPPGGVRIIATASASTAIVSAPA